MVKGVLDSTSTSSDFYNLIDDIVASNPQLNKAITDVRNETNLFLCKILRFYTIRDLCWVRELGTGEEYLCHMTHEMLSYEVSLNTMCDGVVKQDAQYGTYIEPYSDIYGIVGNVRFKGTTDEKCLFSCLNYDDNNSLFSNVRNGEIRLKVGESTLSLTDKRINLRTPTLIVNGLPYNEPELKNYYDKSEISTIKSDTDAQLESLNNKVDALDIDHISELLNQLSEVVSRIDIDDIDSRINSKQDKLISGTNIKTINNQSLMGNGNIEVNGFSGDYDDLTDKPNIPSKTSDLVNDGDDGTNPFVSDDDSRLSDARTPTSHTHGYINNDGTIDVNSASFSTLNYPLVRDNSDGKLKTGLLSTYRVMDSRAYSNIGSSANADQTTINGKINTAIGNINTSLSGKASSTHTHSSADVTEASALSNIGTSASATQHTVNTAIDTAIGELWDGIEGKRNVQRAYCEVPNDVVEEGHYYKLGGIVYDMQNQGMSFLDVMVDDYDRIVQVCYEYDSGEAPDNDVHQYIRYSTNNGNTWSSWKRFVEEVEFTTALNGFYTKDEIDVMVGINWHTFFNHLDCVNNNFDDLSNGNYTLLLQ